MFWGVSGKVEGLCAGDIDLRLSYSKDMKMGLTNDLKSFDLKASYWVVDLEMPAGFEGVLDITAEFGDYRTRTRADIPE